MAVSTKDFFTRFVQLMAMCYWIPVVVTLLGISFAIWRRFSNTSLMVERKHKAMRQQKDEVELVFSSVESPQQEAENLATNTEPSSPNGSLPFFDENVRSDLTSLALIDRLTSRLIIDPVILSCGEVFGRAAIIEYMLGSCVHYGSHSDLYVSPPPLNQPFSSQPGGGQLRSHNLMLYLLRWLKNQPDSVRFAIIRNPNWLFFVKGETPILENIQRLLIPSTPPGFLETWYDGNYFLKDPVVGPKGDTIDLPDNFTYLQSYLYNDLVFCTGRSVTDRVSKSPSDLPMLDRLNWVRPSDSNDFGLLSGYIVSKTTQDHSNTHLTDYYPDRITFKLIEKVKRYAAEYAIYKNLSPSPQYSNKV